MSYEFKRLSDVEVTTEPTETANVLIEEGGVIKKTSMLAARGRENGEYYIAGINGEYIAPDGLYEALQNMFNNYAPINVSVYEFSDDGGHSVRRYQLDYWWVSENGFEAWCNSVYHAVVHPDNSVEFYYDD